MVPGPSHRTLGIASFPLARGRRFDKLGGVGAFGYRLQVRLPSATLPSETAATVPLETPTSLAIFLWLIR
jgi:hypothetical protein